MAVYLTNSFEGITPSGTTITTGNSGGTSGNAFDTVTIGASATVASSNTEAAHGSLSGKLVTPVSSVNAFLQWSTSLTATTLNQIWFRAYCYFPAIQGAGVLRLIEFLDTATLCGYIGITAAGKVTTNAAAGTLETTSATTIPTNAWFRLEGFCVGSATVGQLQVSIYTTPDSGTATETNTSTANVNTTSAMNTIRFGNPSSLTSFTFYLDDLGASDTGLLGPSQFTGTGTGALTLAATSTGSVPGAAKVHSSSSLAAILQAIR